MSELHTPAAGQVVGGRYRLRAPIAAGAMGVVWEAEHIELGRTVAVKVLTEEAARTPTAAKRFEREALALSRIRHPHVVDVLDFGRLASGAPFLVMEHLEGETLAGALERGRVALGDVCDWLRPVARGLDAAHAAGVLHRDVKPANVIRARSDRGDRVVLVDFGLAALEGEGDDGRLTGTHAIVGTPAYLAPEAAKGGAWSAASDVYALACVAYEMLTGRVPHARDSVLGILTARLVDPPPAPSGELGADTPPGLDAVFARALSPDPAERPPSASALLRELVRVAEGRAEPRPAMALPTVRREPPASPRAERRSPPRRRRRSTGLWLALAATLGTVLYALWIFGSDAPSLAESSPAPKTSIAALADGSS